MNIEKENSIAAFMVYEPSYWWGLLATIGSLLQCASKPLDVFVIAQNQHCASLFRRLNIIRKVCKPLGKIEIIIFPEETANQLGKLNFDCHFKPEILYRLYVMDLIPHDYSYLIYMDIDMIWAGDIFQVNEELPETPRHLLYAVQDGLQEFSAPVRENEVTQYANSGFLVLDCAHKEALNTHLRKAQKIAISIAGRSSYLDQDAINIAFKGKIGFLPVRWNFKTADYLKAERKQVDAIVLHATGSRKPWQILSGHPYRSQYIATMKSLNIPWKCRYDFLWFFRKLEKRIKKILRISEK